MACSSIQTWTVSSLITAFLELALAFLLLWLASITFITAKFVSIFGLHLPCTCSAFSQDQNSRVEGTCVQRALVEDPSRRISAISHSVLSKFPFDANCTCEGIGSCCSAYKRLGHERSADAAFNRMLAGKHILDNDKCCWHSPSSEGGHLINRRTSLKIQDKDTEITPGNTQYSSRAVEESKVCCRQRDSCFHCAYNSLHSNDRCFRHSFKWKVRRALLQDSEGNPLDSCENGQPNVIAEGSNSLFTGSLEENSSDKELPGASDLYVKVMGNRDTAQAGWDPPEGTSYMVKLDKPPNSGNGIVDKDCSLQVLESSGDGRYTSQENDPESFGKLKEALRAECEARNALYLELEKERSSAATAADEAMAMILRLQNEKASVEMEARQYKRMVEEKTAYDEEAINILKEIVMKREREKVALENEVEIYRRRLLSHRIDRWERGPHTEAEEHMNESNSFSHGGGQKPVLLPERQNECHVKQETVPEGKNLLSMDTGPVMEKESDKSKGKLNGKAKNALNASGSNLLKSFEHVEDENVLNADELQISADHGHMKSSAIQASNGDLGIDRMELMKPTRAVVEKCSSPQQGDLGEDHLEPMLRLDEQCRLLQSMEVNGVAQEDFASVANLCQRKCLAGEDIEQKKNSLERSQTFEEALFWRNDGFKKSDNTRVLGFNSCNGKGLGNSDVDGLQIVKDEAGHRLEDDLNIHDVHVVLDDIWLSSKNDKEDNMVSSNKLSSDSHERSGLLDAIEEKGGLPLPVENAALMESNSAGISSGHENDNPTSGEQKIIEAGGDLNTGDLVEKWLVTSPSNDLRTKSMIIRDNARMRVEKEVECLTGRLRVLEAGRQNLILSVEFMEKEKIQLKLLEEIAQQLREIRLSEGGMKSIRKGPLPSSSVKSQRLS